MADPEPDGTVVERLGWRLAVDPATETLHLEHADSGTEYELDAAGNLTVPEDGDTGGDLQALQATLAAALDDADSEAADSSATASNCTVECDEQTGEVTIQSDAKISMTAPDIDLDATGGAGVTISGTTLDLSADSSVAIDAQGPMNLTGALINLN